MITPNNIKCRGQLDRLARKLPPTISPTSHRYSVAFFCMDGDNLPLYWRINILSNLRAKGILCKNICTPKCRDCSASPCRYQPRQPDRRLVRSLRRLRQTNVTFRAVRKHSNTIPLDERCGATLLVHSAIWPSVMLSPMIGSEIVWISPSVSDIIRGDYVTELVC